MKTVALGVDLSESVFAIHIYAVYIKPALI